MCLDEFAYRRIEELPLAIGPDGRRPEIPPAALLGQIDQRLG